jgi:hypothetical protein
MLLNIIIIIVLSRLIKQIPSNIHLYKVSDSCIIPSNIVKDWGILVGSQQYFH